jgi:hypothetical protein
MDLEVRCKTRKLELTLPSVSLRMNLYWKVVLGGRFTVIVQTGYDADDRAS